jgi:hypothetical protein
MKFRILITALLMAQSSAYASEALTGCAAKHAEVTQQIEYAEAHGNSAQTSGLKKALSEIEEHCTNANLTAERQEKVREKQSKVTEREADLREAQASGSAKKIARQQAKLESAKQELKAAQDALSE